MEILYRDVPWIALFTLFQDIASRYQINEYIFG